MDKRIISTSLVLSMLLVGCGTDDASKAQWDLQQNMKNGNYQAVIDNLGDCEAKSGDEKLNCYSLKGEAYFKRAGFDYLSLGSELVTVEDDEDFNAIIFEKLLEKDVRSGVDEYNKVLDATAKSNCNEDKYDTLTKTQKDACLATNPILLKDLVEDEDGEDSKPKDTATTNLADVIEFTDVMQDAAPGISGKELSDIVNDKTPSSNGDANNNGELDKLEATNCLLDAYNNNGGTITTACNNDGVSITNLGVNVFATATGTTYDNIDSKKVTIGTTDYYKLIKDVGNGSTLYTVVNVDETKKVGINAVVTDTTSDVNGTSIFNMPIVENNNVGTLNETVSNTLNDEDKFKTIALLVNSENDNDVNGDSIVNEADKVLKFQQDICDTTGTTLTANSNFGNCTVGSDGKLTVPQNAILEYMNKN